MSTYASRAALYRRKFSHLVAAGATGAAFGIQGWAIAQISGKPLTQSLKSRLRAPSP